MTTRPSVAIVGGGIGGLFAANALLARGLRVTVYEQAPAIGEIGAGVYVTPNAVRHLESVGLGPAVERWGARVGPGSALFPPRRRADRAGAGDRRRRLECRASACTAPTTSSFLAAHLPAGVVRTGHRAVGFEQDADIARVKFANGAAAEADVVVGADGIHSELRPHVFPPSKPVFHGTISYRGLVPRERLPDWPMDRWQMWAGPTKHFLVFPVRHGEMVNYVGFVPTDEEMKESWSAPGDPEVLRREFHGWDPRIGRCWSRSTRRSAGRSTTASRCRPGPRAGSRCSATRRIRCCRTSARAPTRRSRTAWRSPPSSRRPTRPRARPLLAYERLRRERVAEVQLGARKHGLRVDSMGGDLAQARRRSRRARRIPQAALRLRRGAAARAARKRCGIAAVAVAIRQAGLLRHFADAPSSSRISAASCSGVGVDLQDAERRELRRDGRRLDRLLDRVDERLARVLRDARRREKAEPDAEQLLLVAELLQRRDVRESATRLEVTRPRKRPALMCALSAPSASTTPSMCPPRNAVTAGAAPV